MSDKETGEIIMKGLGKAKVYFMGCSGIKDPVDMNGNIIKAGDKLTFDYADSKTVPDSWIDRPFFIVQEHKSGKGLCGVGMQEGKEDFYLHDFRFKFAKIVN